MARHPQPPELKVLLGNPGKRPIPKTAKAKGDPVAPKSLSKAAQIIWKRTVMAQAPGVFTQADENALAIYCETVAEFQLATREIAAEGYMTKGSMGQMVPSPWVKVKNEAARLILSYQQRLGFDPIARANLNADEPSDEDDGVE